MCTITLGTVSADIALHHVLNQLPEVIIVCYQYGEFRKRDILDKSMHR